MALLVVDGLERREETIEVAQLGARLAQGQSHPVRNARARPQALASKVRGRDRPQGRNAPTPDRAVGPASQGCALRTAAANRRHSWSTRAAPTPARAASPPVPELW